MTLRIHNTLTRRQEAFVPLEPGHVRMYVCGITVYDLCHLGHARMMMAFDMVYRWLLASGLRVTYVRNITDIEDKIIKRALERGITIRQLTDEMIAAMHRDFAALGTALPTHEPRATDYVPQMLSLIGTLQGKGLAYQAASGDVNFAVRRFRATASCRASRWTNCVPANAWPCRATRTTRWTLCCGSLPSPTSRQTRSGPAPTAQAGPAGTSNARP
jgi:cysteinyl-tRNA synthetase